MDYSFESLGATRFQQLAQALLVRAYEGVACYPVGQADGGRDAARMRGKELHIYQVKFTDKARGVRDPVTWLTAAVRGEARRIQELQDRGATRYHLMTNVSGSAALDVGQRDVLQRNLAELVSIPVEVWWREELTSHLDDAWDVKWAYAEVMSTVDLLRLVLELGGEDARRRKQAVMAYINDQYARDEDVRFKQVELQNRLLDLFVDVPIHVAPEHGSERTRQRTSAVLNAVAGLHEGEEDVLEIRVDADVGETYILRSDADVGAASFLLDQRAAEQVPAIVLEGAPGQGKSTVTQYVCQVHRIRLLGLQDELERLPSDHRGRPLRLPLRVDLRDFAAWLARRNPFAGFEEHELPADWKPSLESFLAAQINHSSGGAEFSVADLHAVAGVSALLIVLDGLDEVPELEQRKQVVERVQDGTRRLTGIAASLQVVMTSRPAAFANSPGPTDRHFAYCSLAPLPRSVVDQYVANWLKVRKIVGRDAADFKSALGQRLELPHLRELSRNPMQLAILLSLVRARGESLPEKRTALYDAYVDLFLDREAEKSIIVRRNRELLKSIHQYLAWRLQSEAQVAGGNGAIAEERLKDVLRGYLAARDHPAGLVDELFQGVTERVVALVSRLEGSFEFEVQPLREYFAARYLYETAPYSPVGAEASGTRPERLRALVRDPYWLNVARFFAGCHSVGELAGVADELEALVEDTAFENLGHGRALGAMLLGDWVFAQDPRSRARVIESVLSGPRWRLLFAGEGSRRSNPLLSLPEAEGGEFLMARAFELIRTRLKSDYNAEILQILRSSFSGSALAGQWLQDDALLANGWWWRIGAQLGCLNAVDEHQIDHLITKHGADEQKIVALLSAGLSRLVERKPVLLRQATNALLENHADVIGSDPVGLTAALSTVLRLSAIRPRMEQTPTELASSLRAIVASGDPEGGMADEIRLVVAEFIKDTKSLGDPPTETWRRTVDTATSLWGERDALWRLAIDIAVRPSRTEKGERSNLDDQDVALVDRVRYARLQAGNSGWWASQLGGRDETLVPVAAAFVTFASPPVVTALASTLDTVLSRLSARDYSRMWTIARNPWRRPVGVGVRFDSSSAYGAAVLWPRIDKKSRAQLRRLLFEYGGTSLEIRRLAGTEAGSAALEGEITWAQALAIVAGSYAVGAVPVLQRLAQRAFADASGLLTLDDMARREVLGSPEAYPGHLVAWAERLERIAVLGHVPPVPLIAQKANWFPLDNH